MELVKMEKKSFSKSDFEILAGYTKKEGNSGAISPSSGMKTQQEIMAMSLKERVKYIDEMKNK